jgi:uncharacterized membrane protein HdeD (DUF308 family)
MRHWLIWLMIGIISILGGIFALANPIAATIAAERIAAWLFLILGILQVLEALRDVGTRARIWTLLGGIAAVFVGVSLLANPLAGVLPLTLLVALLFLAEGLVKLVVSFGMRGTQYFWPVLLSGVISIVLAVMILSNFPASAVTVLGLLLAVELISNGVSLVAFSLARRGAPG